MKLKYQMRGLGIGIVVTALLMGVATKDGLPLSDAEIRAKALALGMIESESLKLTDIQNMAQPSGATPAPAQSGEDAPDGGGEQKELSEDGNGESDGTAPAENTEDAVQASGSGTGSDKEAPGNGDGEKEGTSGNETGTGTEDGTVTVRIEAGTNSYGASVLIAEAGLVEDAAALDRFLCEQGYSRKIADGTYKIPVGATEEEIAKIITKGR